MKCPNCNETLFMSERYNIQIDYCPSCRGIWLDKGELDKMLEYAADKSVTKPETPDTRRDDTYRDNDHDHDRKKYHQHGKPYKKKSFLGDLFDFD